MKRGTAAAVLLLAAVLPLLPLLIWAVSNHWRYPGLLPQDLTLRGLGLLTRPRSQIPRAVLTSAGIASTVAFLACLIGLPAGRALGLYRFPGRRLVQFLLLAPVIVPSLAVTLGLQIFFIRHGLADTVPGVVLAHLIPAVPYAATVLAAAFANLDVDYERQARTLGAGPIRILLFVTIPLMRPALIAAALFAFLISWSEYVLTLLIGGGQVTTLPLLVFAAIGSSDTTVAATLGLLMVAPPLLLIGAASRVLSTSAGTLVGFGRL